MAAAYGVPPGGALFALEVLRGMLALARSIEPRSIYDARRTDEEVATRQKSREASSSP